MSFLEISGNVRIRVGRFGSHCQLLVLVLGLARPAAAAELHLQCDLLSNLEHDELTARVQLLLLAAPAPAPDSIHLRCGTHSVSISAGWSGRTRTAAIEKQGASVEGILRTIEGLLAAKAPRRPRPATKTSKPRAPEAVHQPSSKAGHEAPQEPNASERGAPLVGRKQSIGGLALGAVVEPWPSPASVGLGPRLDVAWGWGSWAATAVETLRLGRSHAAQLVAFDATLGVAWGAPFGSERVGAALAAGAEWFSATSSRAATGERTIHSSIVSFGLRFAEPFGPLAVWLGVDTRVRFSKLALEPPIDATLSRWTVLVSLSGALRVE